MIIGLIIVGPSYSSIFTKVSGSFGGPSYSHLESLCTIPTSGINPLTTIVLMSAITSFLFLYNNAPTYFSGEIKRAEKGGLFYGIIVSYIVTAIMALALLAELQNFIGEKFYDYTSFNGWDYSNGSGIPIATTSILAYVSIPFLNNPALIILFVASAITWYILYAIINLAIPTRTLFAISFDWLAPTFFTKVHEKFRTPIYATLFITGLNVIFDILEIYLGFSESAITTVIVFMLYQYFLAAIAAVVIAKKKLYGINDNRIGILGIISAIVLIIPAFFLIYYGIISSSFASLVFPNLTLNLGIIIGVPIVALVLFEVIRRIREKQGIDLSLTFSEIPPE